MESSGEVLRSAASSLFPPFRLSASSSPSFSAKITASSPASLCFFSRERSCCCVSSWSSWSSRLSSSSFWSSVDPPLVASVVSAAATPRSSTRRTCTALQRRERVRTTANSTCWPTSMGLASEASRTSRPWTKKLSPPLGGFNEASSGAMKPQRWVASKRATVPVTRSLSKRGSSPGANLPMVVRPSSSSSSETTCWTRRTTSRAFGRPDWGWTP
mmetsp:Transcript_24204/g.78068  ORF Transcript_24204/g.78068 Transcript_24204/m.78068 type:complete len:215 (-) Transcript_24204:1325-1969(-)